jgi:hypothetical protein
MDDPPVSTARAAIGAEPRNAILLGGETPCSTLESTATASPKEHRRQVPRTDSDIPESAFVRINA